MKDRFDKGIRFWVIIVVVLAVCVFISDDIQDNALHDDCHDSNRAMKNGSNHPVGIPTRTPNCAPWLNISQKKIVFIAMESFDNYPQSVSADGEHYMGASMEWAAKKLGFEVEHVQSINDFNQKYNTIEKANTFHRVIVSGGDKSGTQLLSYQWKETKCHIRQIEFSSSSGGGGGGGTHVTNSKDDILHTQQILKPYPSSDGTFMGFFVHEMLTQGELSGISLRNKTGLLQGRYHDYQDSGTKATIRALLHAGFVLHTMCTDCNGTDLTETISADNLVHHGWLTPRARLGLLRECAFVIGMGHISYPLPLVGFAVGTVFLNPLASDGSSQYDPVAKLGPPYVYHVNLSNETEVVRAAQMAVDNSFPFFAPYEYRPETMLARMCSVLEDESACSEEQSSSFNLVAASTAAGRPLITHPENAPIVNETAEPTFNLSTAPSSAPTEPKPICAPWVTGRFRKVVFIDLPPMERFLTPGGSKSGEFYMGASMDWAAQQLGFEVEHIATYDNFNRKYKGHAFARAIRRIFFNGVDHVDRIDQANSADVRCHIRPIDFFNSAKNLARDFDLHPKQILQPYPSTYGTFMGYFVHELLTEPGPTEIVKNTKSGLIMGKSFEYFDREDVQVAIGALLGAGFTLHSVCSECKKTGFFKRIFGTNYTGTMVEHDMLSPGDYRNLVRECAFMLGLRDPVVSPSPLIGFSVGTAFLNPIVSPEGRTQHDPIARLEAPYVYRVNLSNQEHVIRAAQSAVDRPFPSFVPYEYRPNAMLARMCAMLEDESVCSNRDLTNSSLEVRVFE